MPNPLLNDKAFEKAAGGDVAVLDRPRPADPARQSGPDIGKYGVPAPPLDSNGHSTMTIGGTCSAAGVMIVFLAVGAAFGWGRVTETVEQVGRGTQTDIHFANPGWLIGGFVIAFVLAMGTMFRPKAARYTAIPYSLCEGFALGIISHLIDAQYKGVAIEAVLATIGVFAVMLLLYGLRILRATPKFVKGITAAMAGILAIFVVQLVSNLFGSTTNNFTSHSPLSIGFSLVVVTVAALRLIIDFDMIERGAKEGAPRYMEWFAAFGLIVGVVWLYIELLSLLAKLQRR
jgi:uncharacterized YccA/Bax inhibitor family protein